MRTRDNRKISMIISAFLISVSILLSGCGENEELTYYKTNMNQFFENVEFFDSSINAIDPESETAPQELLSLLDSMDKSFSQMAELEVPDDFPGVEQLADEASEYMSSAVSYYHQAFDGEEYDSSMADIAKQYYDYANVRLQYIVSILHGDIPEEIFVYDTDEADTENTETN